MARFSQVGVAIGALGAMLILMSLYPGMIGLPPTPGLGVVQIFGFLVGFGLFILGALFYAKFAFYSGIKSNLAQQIGTRLALTGLVTAVMAGLPDALGFGSHGAATGDEDYFGRLQAIGLMGSLLMSCLGVLIYAVAGEVTQENAEEASAEVDERETDDGGDSEREDFPDSSFKETG